jgi:predicted ATPase
MMERTRDRATDNLPLTTTRIVGRADAIELYLRDVRGERLVSIVGSGGVGKTTVALAVAEQAVESFVDGVWWVDFAPLQEPALVPHAIAAATGLVVHSADIMTALCRSLRNRRTLLVLDNCEHMIDALAPCVTQVLVEAPRVHVLTTSRAPLHVPGEQVRRLSGLDVPFATTQLKAADALTYPAIQLFVERATDRLESFSFGDADAPVVANICSSLDGNALAIELAAMRVDVFGVRGLLQQLGDRFRHLGERRAGVPRHRTLAATLDWSYGLLPAHEAALLRTVSVFPGAFRLADAAAVAQLPASEAATILAELVAQSLLSSDADSDIYRPLETTRAYCVEKLLESGADAMVRQQHAEYVCEVLQRATGELAQSPVREWSARYARYLDDLRAALAWAGSNPAQRALLVQLTAAGTVLWDHFSLANESTAHLRRALMHLREAEAAGTAVEMNLQLALAGAILFSRGLMREARSAMVRALEISMQLGDDEYHLRCLRMIAAFQLFGGENEGAIQTLETFLSAAAAVDPSALGDGETHLACAHMFVGRVERARQRLDRLYAQVAPDVSDDNSQRFLYNNSLSVMIVRSHVQWLIGCPDVAEQMAIAMFEYGLAAKHEVTMSNVLAFVCLIYLWTGRDDKCHEFSGMMDDLVAQHGIVLWRPVATFCRGALASQREQTLAEGVKDLERAVSEFHAIGHHARLPYFTGVLAEALVTQGRLQDAAATIRDALEMADKGNDLWSLPELLRIQAALLAAQGRPAEQEATLLKSLALAERIGTKSWRLRAGLDLARRWQAQSRQREAKQLLQDIFDSFSEGFDTRDLVSAAKLLGELR